MGITFKNTHGMTQAEKEDYWTKVVKELCPYETKDFEFEYRKSGKQNYLYVKFTYSNGNENFRSGWIQVNHIKQYGVPICRELEAIDYTRENCKYETKDFEFEYRKSGKRNYLHVKFTYSNGNENFRSGWIRVDSIKQGGVPTCYELEAIDYIKENCKYETKDFEFEYRKVGKHNKLHVKFTYTNGNESFSSNWICVNDIKQGKNNLQFDNTYNGERWLKEFSQEQDLVFDTQQTYEGLRYDNPLFIDQTLHTKNGQLLFIEIDGEAHREPRTFGGISLEQAQKIFEAQKIKDQIKNDYAKDHSIIMIRIPYYAGKSTKESIVNAFLEGLKENGLHLEDLMTVEETEKLQEKELVLS